MNELSLEERKTIRKKLDASYSCSLIANLLGRGKTTVILEVRRNGGKEKYNPELAQKAFEERKDLVHKSRSETLKRLNNPTPFKILFDKVASIEMQLEILTEEIRKLKNGNKQD